MVTSRLTNHLKVGQDQSFHLHKSKNVSKLYADSNSWLLRTYLQWKIFTVEIFLLSLPVLIFEKNPLEESFSCAERQTLIKMMELCCR